MNFSYRYLFNESSARRWLFPWLDFNLKEAACTGGMQYPFGVVGGFEEKYGVSVVGTVDGTSFVDNNAERSSHLWGIVDETD